VLHGTGVIRIGAEQFAVEPGDILAVPSWTPWSLEAQTELDVFSTSDAPVLESLDLMRTQNLSGTESNQATARLTAMTGTDG
jgi:gentisate 1,2-dioxygenase